jgi:hypothetical protein
MPDCGVIQKPNVYNSVLSSLFNENINNNDLLMLVVLLLPTFPSLKQYQKTNYSDMPSFCLETLTSMKITSNTAQNSLLIPPIS